ncbi:hypothetical protein DXG01_001044 [Tephrocybe rancida]|nr:hypothetical protein DXG01_001044 [Tephrocybe rancida]
MTYYASRVFLSGATTQSKCSFLDTMIFAAGQRRAHLNSNDSLHLDNLSNGKGKLSPTSSRLFKLILPLESLNVSEGRVHASGPSRKDENQLPPTIFLLHPSQPLSYISQLILASIEPVTERITYRSTSSSGRSYKWSDSTDIGDFIRDVARSATFSICFTFSGTSHGPNADDHIIVVEIPKLADRTRFLRRRLEHIEKELQDMEDLKIECDHEAHKGARRMAMGGFGMLIVYWASVARLTFWDYGWFLYQGREVSYTSVLHRSISTRREALYTSRGFDIEHWTYLTSEAMDVRKEILRIAEDYDENDKMKEDESIKIPQELNEVL